MKIFEQKTVESRKASQDLNPIKMSLGEITPYKTDQPEHKLASSALVLPKKLEVSDTQLTTTPQNKSFLDGMLTSKTAGFTSVTKALTRPHYLDKSIEQESPVLHNEQRTINELPIDSEVNAFDQKAQIADSIATD